MVERWLQRTVVERRLQRTAVEWRSSTGIRRFMENATKEEETMREELKMEKRETTTGNT